MTTPDRALDLALVRDDLAYHQARVLLLVTAVAGARGHSSKLDGLTKLAKLDFLLRYPALAPSVLDRLDPADPRLRLTDDDRAEPASAEAPMVRYKYGPWDDRYYPVIGALVSRGLLRYTRGRRGSVALAPTPAGRALAQQLGSASEWNEIADRSRAIADASSGLTGNALKDLIYNRLAVLMDRPHRETIQ
jgi:hypothetical protein